MLKKDDIKLGIILGLIAPLFGMLAFYFWKFRIYSFKVFLEYLGLEKRLLTGMISFALFANAIVFTIFINKHLDKTATGIFIVTIIYALIAIGLKFWY
jgi:hypothetical protein